MTTPNTCKMAWLGSLVLGAGLWLTAQPAQAVLMNITGDTGDAQIEEVPDGTGNATGSYTITRQTDTTLQAGVFSRPGGDSRAHFGTNPIFAFQLPTGVTGGITDANLSFYLKGMTSGSSAVNFNSDLYGLGYRSALTLDATGLSQNDVDYFEGAFNTDPSTTNPATGIQASILTPGSSVGQIQTDAAGDAALVAYLNAQYTAGAQAGDFVFFRLNQPTDLNSNVSRYYTIASADNAGSEPVLSITVAPTATAVPEPATLALLGVGGLLLLGKRRKGVAPAQ